MLKYEEQTEVVEVSEPQADVINARTPYILDMAGQGGGKTELIGLLSGQMISSCPHAKGFIGANTDKQLSHTTLSKTFKSWKRNFGFVQYDPKRAPGGHYVVNKQPPPHFLRFEEMPSYHGTISFRNGALIYIGSLKNYLAHDGKEFAWAHLDETKDTKKEALTTVIFARLRQPGLWFDKQGEIIWDTESSLSEIEQKGLTPWNPCYVHTSPAEGGADWLIELFGFGKYENEIRKKIIDHYDYFYKVIDNATVVIYSSYWNEENLAPGYLENRRQKMSENEIMKFIYSYPFSKTGGEFFPPFSRIQHVKKVKFKPELSVSLTYDFNVLPYITQVAAQVEYVPRWVDDQGMRHEVAKEGLTYIDCMQIRIFREYCMKSPLNSTESACEAFDRDFEDWHGDVMIYGDASGRNRIVGLGSLTQYKIIEGSLPRFLSNGWLRVGMTNLSRLKRRDLLNRILSNKIPGVELIIDENCLEVIRDFEYVKLGPDGKIKEKAKDPESGVSYEKIGHTSDAVEYLVCELCKDYLKEF